jgi:hypothetical protein
MGEFVAGLGSGEMGERKEEKYSYKKRVEPTSNHTILPFKILDIFVARM